MKTFSSLVLALPFLLASALADPGAQGSIPQPDAMELIEVPGMSTRELLGKPKNLARWHMGAVFFDGSEGQLRPFTWRDADGQSPALLLSDDPSAELDLTPDVYKYVIELNESYLISRFTFKNFDARGTIEVYAGKNLSNTNHAQWKSLGAPVPFSESGYVSARFDPVETRHVMVVFDITHEGSIGIFGVYGDMSLAEVRMPRTHEDASAAPPPPVAPEDTTKFNFATLTSGSRVTHVSSGDYTTVDSIVDDDVETYYEFPSDSTEDVLIVDLAEQREINRVSMLFESGPGTLNLYLANKLPDTVLPPSDADAHQDGTPGIPTTTGSGVTTEDTAWLHIQDQSQPLLLLASTSGRLGEWLALATLFAAPQAQRVALPQSFFDDTPAAMEVQTDGSSGRLRIDFENIVTRYLIVRFTPEPGAPSPHGLRVYEIGMFGDVPEDRRRLVPTPLFEFFEADLDVTPTLTAPPVIGTVVDGGDPRPPPPVSP